MITSTTNATIANSTISKNIPLTDLEDKELEELVNSLTKEELNILICDLDGYKDTLVDIEKFIYDPFYLGNAFKDKTNNTKKIYPIWEEALKEIFPTPYYSPYSELGFSGAIGVGKSTAARIGVLYDCYKILMTLDPHDKFNLIKSDIIIVALFSANLKLASLVLYEPFRNLIKSSPFFRNRLLNQEKETGPIKFPNNTQILAGSRFTHILGMAPFVGILDEVNFQGSVKTQAFDSYAQMSSRMASRFMQYGGVMPGHLFLVSSKKDENAFLEHHIKNSKNNPGFKLFEYSIWEAKRHLENYSGEIFSVFIGNDKQSPRILKDAEVKEFDSGEVVFPPIEYLQQFKTNIELALRDVAGKTSIVGSKYISYPEAVTKSVKLVNVSKDDYIFLDFDDDKKLIDFVSIDRLKSYLNMLPNASRFIHLDIGVTNDAYGLAMCTCSDYKKMSTKKLINDPKPQEGLEVIVEPIIRCELAMGIKSRIRVPFFKIREFIDDLVEVGFPITTVTADSFESEDTLQLLTKKGFIAEVLSLDKNKIPHVTFRNALYEDRVELPDHPIMRDELVNLINAGKKFDHLPGKTKDISDAIVGATYKCINAAHSFLETYGSSYL